jgi:peroxiredoxin
VIDPYTLPDDLPAPVDDGACDHLAGLALPPLELAERLHLPFPILSDAGLALTRALALPTFEAAGQTLIRRLTLLVRDGAIERVWYPVFPPDRHPGEVLAWLRENPA